MTSPLTDQQLDEIEARAAHLHEYGDPTDTRTAGWEELAGTDVPALLAEVRRQRDRIAELEVGLNDLAALVSQWCDRATKAEARVAELERPAVDSDTLAAWLSQRFDPRGPDWEDLTEDDRSYWEHHASAVRRAVSRGGFKAVAPDAASGATSAPLGAVQGSSVSESTQSPTGAPTAPRRTLTPNEYDAAWHAVEGAAGDEGADPGTVLHAVLDRLGIEWQDAASPTAAAAGGER
jgi:hypothetical protein